MLDRTGNADGYIKIGRDHLAGLPHLPVVRRITRIDGGAFPATNDELNAPEFVGKEFEYFGGQKVNEVLSASAASVVDGWQYLPFQVYANSIFGDTVGQAYVSDTTLVEGLQAWQDASVKYGQEQGFTVD